MPSTRRRFVSWALLASALGFACASLPGARAESTPAPADGGAPVKLKLLILGGTSFLGPALVESAQARGHTVTLFNRGKTRPELFPDIEKLRGDRDPDKGDGLKALEGRDWDAVIDTSGYFPRIVKASAELLKDHVKQYVFVSTISVYAGFEKNNMDETAPVGTIEDTTVEQITGGTYGPLKALCEQAAEAAMPGRVTVARPGLIVGPEDPSDRFTYWPVRVEKGGEVLAPGSPDDLIQVIDARDLADWIVSAIEHKHIGVYNLTGPKPDLTIGRLLDTCKSVAKSDATFTWVDADFLEAHDVAAWRDMPAWIPAKGEYTGFGTINIDRALATGLKFRPIEVTCRDTLAWFHTLPEDRQEKFRSGIKLEREAEVLKAWHERDNTPADSK